LTHSIIETIVSNSPEVRNRTAEELLDGLSPPLLLAALRELECFRKASTCRPHRARACFFTFAICRFHLLDPDRTDAPGRVGAAVERLLEKRNFDRALARLVPGPEEVPSPARLSALAAAAYGRAFELLLEQVTDSIRARPGNRRLFVRGGMNPARGGLSADYLVRDPASGLYPVETCFSPVRIDPCHSGWSDIFHLATDFPTGARVVNLSVNISPRGRGQPGPPIECYARVIEKPVISLFSLDLGCRREISRLEQLFQTKADRVGLLKAGVIAAGIVPPASRGGPDSLTEILAEWVGPGRGLEVATRVRNLPPGSRLAVSTALLNAVITVLMKMSGQLESQEGGLTEADRRLVAARTILGEWLGGSGGGWQDSGGLWPGVKRMEGVPTGENSRGERGMLLPRVTILSPPDLPGSMAQTLRRGLVLFHTGQARNVGPILEMVTEKYLLRYRREWRARKRELAFYEKTLRALRRGDLAGLGRAVNRDWEEGTKQIIPSASDPLTEDLIAQMRQRWGKACLGFLMLGGAAGGGMAFVIDPAIYREFSRDLLQRLRRLRRRYAKSFPFLMEPRIFDFSLSNTGLESHIRRGAEAVIPDLSPQEDPPREAEENPEDFGRRYGFEPERQAGLRRDYRKGRIGLERNRLPPETRLSSNVERKLQRLPRKGSSELAALRRAGIRAIRDGEAAIITLAGGMGSRWSEGGGVVKALSPVAKMRGRYRCFLEIHLSKSELSRRRWGIAFPHVFTTSFLTHSPIKQVLRRENNYGYQGKILLSQTPSLRRRLIPTERDLRADTSEPAEQEGLEALIRLARKRGFGNDYSQNSADNLFHPAGHWYEIPGLVRNGTLARLLRAAPGLRHLLVHNLDTLGTTLDPGLLGLHVRSGSALTFEVTPRWRGDRGGYLARVDGQIRLVENLALPRPEQHFRLQYYNSLTSWIDIDALLEFFGLDRDDILGAARDRQRAEKIEAALSEVERLLPTYITLKNVREDRSGGTGEVFRVAQAEKLWGDVTSLEGLACFFVAVSRRRAQQLKDPDGLDHWIRDGSLAALSRNCRFAR